MIFPDTIAPLFIAIILDAVIGDPRWFYRVVPHPTVAIGWCVSTFDRAFNNGQFSPIMRRGLGIVAVIAAAGIATAIGLAVHQLLQRIPYGNWAEVLFISTLLSQNSLYRHVDDVAAALERDGPESGRQAVAHIVGRKTEFLDEEGVSRAAIESLAENFSDGVVAPIFWGLLFGLPGVFAYKVINTADSMIGHRDEKYRAFGWATARLDDAVNYIPARIAGLTIAAAGLSVSQFAPARALRTMWRDGPSHRSLNAGFPEAAMASVLDLKLGGPRQYGGEFIDDPWLGDGDALATSAEIRRGLRIYVVACCWVAASIGAATLIWLPL